MKKAQLIFYGGADAVTGSNFMLKLDNGQSILVDCGLTQGTKELENRNWQSFAYNPADVDVLLVTHAHMDHIGLIGKLVAEGFKGKIYSTSATKALSQVMLADGLRIMQEEAKQRELEPLWSDTHLQEAFSRWETNEYHEEFSPTKEVKVEFFDAGHILGSAMVKVSYGDEAITFSGDLGNSPSPLLENTEAVKDSKYLVMEAVYGDRNHDDRTHRQAQLRDILKKAIHRGGPIIIPAFSLERTQVLLYELNELIESGELPVLPVFLDSPLAINVLSVYEQFTRYFNQAARDDISSGDDIFRFPGLVISKTKKDSQAIIKAADPKIIIAGSGMSHAGRVIFHQFNYLSDSQATLLFISYQAPGTFGRQIIEGNKRVRLLGRHLKVKAKVETLLSYSSHKDMTGLHEFAKTATKNGTKEIFVTLAEPSVAISFSNLLNNDMEVSAKIHTPEFADEITLDF